MQHDLLGNPVSAASAAARSAIDDFVDGFLGYETKATRVLAAADSDPESTLANVYAGFCWMFLEAAGAEDNAARYLARASASARGAHRREKMLLAQLERWIGGDVPGVQAIGEALVEEFPTDLAAVKLHQYFSFNRGDAAAMLRIARKAERANADNPHLHGMLAFGYEQLHRIDKAEACARTALSLKEKEPWAQHALAHVMLSSGRVREGVAFMTAAAKTWVDLNSFMYSHSWWHLALFQLALGDEQAVLDAYDHHVWGQEKDYSQDQVGAVSLLARMEMAGMEVGRRWDDVAAHMRSRATDTLQPFLTIQYLYGLARAGRAEADQLMAAVEDRAARATGWDRQVWQEVALPGCRGVLAHARGDCAEALRGLSIANPRMAEIGGSHAQRDLFALLLLDAHLKAGHWDIACQLLEARRSRDPDGVPLNRALAMVYRKLGNPQEAAQAAARHYA